MSADCGRSGQAIVATNASTIILTFAFLALFRLSHMLTGKIIAEHAAMRVARARSVGLNDFMCVKAARIATIPVSGTRLWPQGEEFDHSMERARSKIYMASENGAIARGILEYAGWDRLVVHVGDGADARVAISNSWFSVSGDASFESNSGLYMYDTGL